MEFQRTLVGERCVYTDCAILGAMSQQDQGLREKPRDLPSKGILPYVGLGVGVTLTIALYVIVSAIRALTNVETALIWSVGLLLNLCGSFLLGRRSQREVAEERATVLARSALRRVVSLRDALQRLQDLIEEERNVLAERANARDLRVNEMLEVSFALQGLKNLFSVVTEHIATAEDAIEDWKDVAPQEWEQIQQQMDLAARIEELEPQVQQAQSLAETIERSGEEQAERAVRAERRAEELSDEVKKLRDQLAELRRRSPVAISPATTTGPKIKRVDVPDDFPAVGSPLDAIGSVGASIFSGYSRCQLCNRSMGILDTPRQCVNCERSVCPRHVTSEEQDPDGPRCVECWKSETNSQ